MAYLMAHVPLGRFFSMARDSPIFARAKLAKALSFFVGRNTEAVQDSERRGDRAIARRSQVRIKRIGSQPYSTPASGYGKPLGRANAGFTCFRSAASHTAYPQLISRSWCCDSRAFSLVGVWASLSVISSGQSRASGSW